MYVVDLFNIKCTEKIKFNWLKKEFRRGDFLYMYFIQKINSMRKYHKLKNSKLVQNIHINKAFNFYQKFS